MRTAAAGFLVAAPWLNPVAQGPSPQVQPWLFSLSCGVVLWMLAGGLRGHARPSPWLSGVLVAVAAWAALSQLALRPEVVMLAGGLALVLLSAAAASDRRLADGLQLGLLLAATASALMGLAQYLGLSAGLAPWVNEARPGNAFANIRQTNQYSSLCWIATAVVLFGTVRLPRRASFALMVLLATGSAAAVSRTGVLQGISLLAIAACWPAARREQRVALCATAAAAYVIAALLLPVLLEASTGTATGRTLWTRLQGGDGCSSRLVLWSNVLRLVAERPWTGWGWGELDFAHYMHLYEGLRFCEILDNAHNLPLHLAVELGVPAAMLLCAAALLAAWRQRPWAEADPLRQLAWAVLLLLGLHSLLEYPLWYGPFQIAAGGALGWLARPRAEAVPAGPRPVATAIAASLFVAVGHAAWDYERVAQAYLPPEWRRAAWREDTLAHARRSWLFQGQARFAEVTLASTTRANASWMHEEALQALHYSPEPPVIERVVESAEFLGREDEARLHLARYRAAFPREYAEWVRRHPLPPPRKH